MLIIKGINKPFFSKIKCIIKDIKAWIAKNAVQEKEGLKNVY